MQVEKPVHGIVIQGRENVDQWTTVFQVLYKSNESDSFKYVLDENNNPEVSREAVQGVMVALKLFLFT